MNWGQHIQEKLDELAKISEPGPGVTRRYLTKEHQVANDQIQRWMMEAGLQVTIDAVGNVVGTYRCPEEEAPTIIIGSHQDTVIQGGKYDGALGIILPLVVLEESIKQNHLRYHVTLVAFGDEEGVRFSTTYLGSKAVVGNLTDDLLEKVDKEGISLAEALQNFKRDETAIEACKLQGDAYLELHIEQGPVLEENNLPVGIVKQIQASRRYTVCLNGKAGHAGTVPMKLRKDAGRRAAESICYLMNQVERVEEVVATVGRITFYPGAENVIPSEAIYTIDIRSPYPEKLDEVMQAFESILQEGDKLLKTNDVLPTKCDVEMIEWLAEAVRENGTEVMYLNSGAGHDAQEMSTLMPVGMLFIRCREGLSHHPDESVSLEDLDEAAKILYNCLK